MMLAVNDAQRVDAVLADMLPADPPIRPLDEAMRHAVLGGGKRLRPRLVYAAGRLAGNQLDALDCAAVAVELLHAYSLVHDDLPAMDDAPLRRGRPAVHAKFGPATAILAGNALQALAFEALADDRLKPGVCHRWVKLLAMAAGSTGMAGGQMMDLLGEKRPLTLTELEALHRRKTGALICAAVMMGATGGTLVDGERAAVECFARHIGLAFQIHDDVLDATTETAVLGKPQGNDERHGKTTYMSLLGVDGARDEAARVFGMAMDALSVFDSRAAPLRELAHFVIERDH